jgi:glutaconate CoA-transferase subunit A
VSKVTTLAAAVREHIPDGARVAMGCGLESNIPFAVGYEMVRQGKRDLTLIGPISDVLFDLLIGAGCVAEVWAAWVGNVSEGSGYNFRRAAESGAVRIRDFTNLTMALALQAGAWGVPFLPTRTALGTDVVRGREEDFRQVACPFTGERLLAVRAVRPDVTVLHVQRADADGNAHLWGNLGVAVEAAFAAERVVLTCEELVPPEAIRSDPSRTRIPGYLVAAVVHVPRGAHPSPCPGFYDRDNAFYAAYHEATRQGAEAWLDGWVRGVPDHQAYLRKAGVLA